MNDFKKQLSEITTKNIDEKISRNIQEELKQLEQEADLKEYKEQIEERRNGIVHIFTNFEHNMDRIEENNKYHVADPKEDKKGNNEKCLDKIIQKRIWQRLEEMYQYTMNYPCFRNAQEQGKELAQILDRQIRVNGLLEKYKENMAVLELYERQENKRQQKEQIVL